jgi:flagellar basal body P-ring protein FlgI
MNNNNKDNNKNNNKNNNNKIFNKISDSNSNSIINNPTMEDVVRQLNKLTVTITDLSSILSETINQQSTLLKMLTSDKEKLNIKLQHEIK